MPFAQITNIDATQLGIFVLCLIGVMYAVKLVLDIASHMGWLRGKPKDADKCDLLQIEIPKGVYVTHQEQTAVIEKILKRIEDSEERASVRADGQGSDLHGLQIEFARMPIEMAKVVKAEMEPLTRRINDLYQEAVHGRK